MKPSPRLALTSLLALLPLLSGGPVFSQILFFENFDDSASAATRFVAKSGSAVFSAGALTLTPNQTVMLNSANPTGDTGTAPVLYQVTQTFAPGSVLWPQRAQAQFRARAKSSSWNDGYYLLSYYSSGGAMISLNRITDVEIGHGVFATTLIGGTLITPPVIASLGPYDLGLSFANTPTSVDITVLINGTPAVSVHDTSPYRLTSGNSLGFLCEGTHAASWDNLSVAVIPEPHACAFLLFGFGLFFQHALSRNCVRMRIR